VTPPVDPLHFFDQAKARSLHKLNIFDGYLRPFTYKLGSSAGRGRRHEHVYVIDGFGGAGKYQPDDDGRIQDGSPLLAAKWARQIRVERKHALVQCIIVERDPDCFLELQRNLAPWQDVATALRGEFAARLPLILETIGDDPALFFLDPFGLAGAELKLIEQIAQRPGKTELLIHFSDRTFLRMAGHLDDQGHRVPIGQLVAESKLARLDAHVGTKAWRLLCPPGADTDRAIDDVAELYLKQLRSAGWRYAHQIRMRDSYSQRPAYRLMFATASQHGVELMSDIACAYERSLKEEEDAGRMTLWHHDEERQHLTDLRDRIFDFGRRQRTATPQEVIHELAPQMFGLYRTSEYNKAIRELVQAHCIDRANATGIDSRERLTFIDPPQTSLLEA
jgi:three-Cys-motif partner protein